MLKEPQKVTGCNLFYFPIVYKATYYLNDFLCT